MAARERSFSASVLNSTRRMPSVSKACLIIRYFASVFAAVRCQSRPSQVQPISTRLFWRSAFAKRVLPTGRPIERATVAKGSAVPARCAASALST